MSGPLEHPDPRDEGRLAQNLGMHFERQDAAPAVVARWAVALGALTIAFAAVSVWLLVYLRGREEKQDPRRPSLYFGRQERRQPQGVRLQTRPFDDLGTLRKREEEILGSYGWVDQPTGVVHIPIEEAMKLYVQRQSGTAGEGGATAASGAAGVPTDSAPVPSPEAAIASPPPAPPASPAPGPAGGRS